MASCSFTWHDDDHYDMSPLVTEVVNTVLDESVENTYVDRLRTETKRSFSSQEALDENMNIIEPSYVNSYHPVGMTEFAGVQLQYEKSMQQMTDGIYSSNNSMLLDKLIQANGIHQNLSNGKIQMQPISRNVLSAAGDNFEVNQPFQGYCDVLNEIPDTASCINYNIGHEQSMFSMHNDGLFSRCVDISMIDASKLVPLDDQAFLRPKLSKRNGPAQQLHAWIEKSYEQFKLIEEDRKEVEHDLKIRYPDKDVTSINNIPIPKRQLKSSRVDRLIIEHQREHANLITLLAKMELLYGQEFDSSLHDDVQQWLNAIHDVKSKRASEIVKTSVNADYSSEEDVTSLKCSVYEMFRGCRKAHLTLLCAHYSVTEATLLFMKGIRKKLLWKN
ncbi:C17orf104 (predicted) [Pycnogonum litorale]